MRVRDRVCGMPASCLNLRTARATLPLALASVSRFWRRRRRAAAAGDEARVACLVNSAGVCARGASRRALARCCAVNALAPAAMADEWLSQLGPAPAAAERDGGGRARGVCVHISSGDGELVFLSERARSLIAAADAEAAAEAADGGAREALDIARALARDVVRAHDPAAPADALAFNECGAPGYAFSKAALNAHARALSRAPRLSAARAAVVAVCPGDVDTRMLRSARSHARRARGAADDDDDAGEVLSPAAAARDVAWVVAESYERPTAMNGRFYRARAEIEW